MELPVATVSQSAPALRPVSLFPPHGLADAEHKPLDRWLTDLSAFFLGLGSDRGLLVAEHIQELCREVACCTAPGGSIDVETFRDRRVFVRDEADGWPKSPSACDFERWATNV